MTFESHIIISQSIKIPLTELIFRTSRSSGPGGQNVNKLETRVELLFDVAKSPGIPENLRSRLLNNLKSHLDLSGTLRIVVQESRSQWKNKQIALEKLRELLKAALVIPKRRKATKPTKSSKEVRLHSKKVRSQIKRLRRTADEE